MSARRGAATSPAATAVVISSHELETIRRHAALSGAGTSVLAPPRHLNEEHRAEERRTASMARAEKWPNTLAAMRRRKEAAREERLARAEAARRVVDEDEERRRLEEREVTLERANRILVENTDKMKLLRSLRLRIHAGEVREHQIAQHKARDSMAATRASAYHETLMRRVAEDEAAEKAKAEEARQAKLAIQASLHSQLAEVKERELNRRAEEKAEGRRILAAARAAEVEERAAEAARAEAQRRNNELMLHANEELRRLKEAQKDKEAEEAERLARYNEAQEAKRQKRAELVRHKHEEAEKRAAEMRSIIEARFSQMMSNEHAVLEKQVADARKKEEDAAAAKRAELEELQRTIDASRTHQVAVRRAAREREVTESKANAAKWDGIVYALEKTEYEEQEARRRRARDLAAENRRMADERARQLSKYHEHELEVERHTTEVSRAGDPAFLAGAGRLLSEEREAGHRTDFIERAIHRAQKDPMIAATAIM